MIYRTPETDREITAAHDLLNDLDDQAVLALILLQVKRFKSAHLAPGLYRAAGDFRAQAEAVSDYVLSDVEQIEFDIMNPAKGLIQ